MSIKQKIVYSGDNSVCGVSVCPKNEKLVVLSESCLSGDVWDGCLTLCDVESCSVVDSFKLHCGSSSVVFIDDKTCIAGLDDGNLGLYSIGDSTEKKISTREMFIAHDDCVSCVCLNPHNNSVVSGALDGSLLFWMKEEEVGLRAVKELLTQVSISSVCCCGDSFAVSQSNGCVSLCDSRTEKRFESDSLKLMEPVNALTSKSETTVIVGTEGGHVYEIDFRAPKQTLDVIRDHKGKAITSLCYIESEDKTNVLISGDEDGFVMWGDNESVVDCSVHNDTINCFVSNGKETVISGGRDGKLCMFSYTK